MHKQIRKYESTLKNAQLLPRKGEPKKQNTKTEKPKNKKKKKTKKNNFPELLEKPRRDS